MLELYLKGMLVAAEPALTFVERESGINAKVFSGSHKFKQKLLPEIDRVFRKLDIRFDFGREGLRTREDFVAFLEDLDQLEVRFPIKPNRKPAMADTFVRFNLFEFAEEMDAILDTLNGYISWIDDEAQGRCEMAQAAREAAWENTDRDCDPPEYEPPEYEPGDYNGG